jgi:hypothetical protein
VVAAGAAASAGGTEVMAKVREDLGERTDKGPESSLKNPRRFFFYLLYVFFGFFFFRCAGQADRKRGDWKELERERKKRSRHKG